MRLVLVQRKPAQPDGGREWRFSLYEGRENVAVWDTSDAMTPADIEELRTIPRAELFRPV